MAVSRIDETQTTGDQLTSPTIFAATARRAFWLPFILLALLAALLIWQIASLLNATRLTDRSDQVSAQASRTLKLAIDAETGERGYLIGGDPDFLTPYADAQKRIPRAFARLKQLAASEPDQEQRAQALEASFALWNSYAQQEMELHDAAAAGRGDVNFPAFFNQGKGKFLMDQIRTQFQTFVESENAIRRRRSQQIEARTTDALWGGGICGVAVAILIAVSTRRSLRGLADDYDAMLSAEQEAREQLGATLISIGDAVLVTDAQGRVTLMNPVAETLTGWSTREAKSKNAKVVFDIVNETTRAVVESPVDRVIREGIVVGLANHTVLRRRDGTEVAIDDSGAPIWGLERKLSGVVLVFRDISERRQAELRTQRIAEQLQQALLPVLPETAPGLVLRGHYRAALTEAAVGGDFVDCFPIEGGAVTCFVVADLSGKGLAAARQVATVRNMLRYALHSVGSFATAITNLNQILAEQELLSGFATLFVGAYDSRTCALTYVNCGQEPGLVWQSSSGTVKQLEPTGPALGAFTGSTFAETTLILTPGDIFALFTDGMTEVGPSRRELLGIGGLADLFGNSAQASFQSSLSQTACAETAKSVIDNMLTGIQSYAGSADNLWDDIALLVGVVRPADASHDPIPVTTTLSA